MSDNSMLELANHHLDRAIGALQRARRDNSIDERLRHIRNAQRIASDADSCIIKWRKGEKAPTEE